MVGLWLLIEFIDLFKNGTVPQTGRVAENFSYLKMAHTVSLISVYRISK